MSKPRVSIRLTVDTLAHAETIKESIETRIAGKDIFELHAIAFGVEPFTLSNYVFVEISFSGRLDRDDLKEWIKDRIQNNPQVRNWVVSAKISDHLCSHDDMEIKDCTTTEYVEWER